MIRKTSVINRKFTSVTLNHENEIMSIFENSNFTSIPIIDAEGRFVKEYYRESDNTDFVPTDDWLKLVCKDIRAYLCKHNEKIIILADGLSSELEKVEEFEKLLRDMGDTIVFWSKEKLFLWRDLENLFEHPEICVCDLSLKGLNVRRYYYDVYHVAYTEYFSAENYDLKSDIEEKLPFFNQIAVTDEVAEYLGRQLVDEWFIQIINQNSLRFYHDENYLEYDGEIDEDVECLIMLSPIASHPLLRLSDRYIPTIDVWSMGKEGNMKARYSFTNDDMAVNIIPKLCESGISHILINYPDNEYRMVQELFPEGLPREGHNLLTARREVKRTFYENMHLNDDEVDEIIKEAFVSMNKVAPNFWSGSYQGKYANYLDGERLISDNPSVFRNILYLGGNCTTRGHFVDDGNTPGSFLRKEISASHYIMTLASGFADYNYCIRKRIFQTGDIIVLIIYDKEIFQRMGYKVHSIIDIYRKVQDVQYCVADTLSHFNDVLNRALAERIYQICKEENLLDTPDCLEEKEVIFGKKERKKQISPQLKEWLDEIISVKSNDAKHAGSIVMNANPFTLGHRYLVEEALKQVDYLYIFVVEEDKSFFSFEDRLEMVKRGVADLKQVIVIPSGKYIISTQTLPGYFEKESCPYVEYDATQDLEIFAETIAKTMDIKVRFVGEEPFDVFTRKYNDSMRNIFPKYDLEFVEIPRKQQKGGSN